MASVPFRLLFSITSTSRPDHCLWLYILPITLRQDVGGVYQQILFYTILFITCLYTTYKHLANSKHNSQITLSGRHKWPKHSLPMKISND